MPYRIIDLSSFVGLPSGNELAEISNAGTKSSQIIISQLALVRAPVSVTGGGTTTIAATSFGDVLVNVNSAVTIQLPSALLAVRFGVPQSVVDIGGFANANNITILPFGSESIMGLSSIKLTSNFGGITLWPIATGGWYQK